MIGRFSIIAGALAFGVVFAPAASAQSSTAADSAVQILGSPDTLTRPRAYQLAPVVIVAAPQGSGGIAGGIQARNDIRDLVRENRALQRQLAQHDQEIVHLEARLERLQHLETRMVDQIAGLDSATAATRAQRERLEARLRAAQERGTIARVRDNH